jgi:hypothetical protein
MLVVDKKVFIDGTEYEGYTILSVEWDLQNDLFGVKVIYRDVETSTKKLKTYYFKVGNEVDINEIIKQTHQLHDVSNQ